VLYCWRTLCQTLHSARLGRAQQRLLFTWHPCCMARTMWVSAHLVLVVWAAVSCFANTFAAS
jgi:hypothetical protein